MTNPGKESVMAKITKLLERANHEGTPEHEARACEMMADRLMAQHMIDRHEAEQAARRRGESTRKPIVNTWTISMDQHHAEGTDSSWEFQQQILSMSMAVLEHCNVRINRNYKYVNGGREYQIVGFPEDIAYAERIWFNVFKAFVQNVNPHWSLDKSVEWNAYTFASAGVSWKDQVLLAEKAGDSRLEWPWRYQCEDPEGDFYTPYSFRAGTAIDPGNKPWGRSIHKLKRACKKYSDDNNEPYPYAAGAKLRVATRNSFARSYRSTIGTRLGDIRRQATEGVDHVDANKYAIAKVDTAQQVDEEFYRLFPEYDPEVQRKKREERDFLRACEWASLSPQEQQKILREEAREEERWRRRQQTARRNFRTVREDPAARYDAAAWARGRSAASAVNLRNDGEVDIDKKKELS